MQGRATPGTSSESPAEEASSSGQQRIADSPWSWASLAADPLILTLQLWATALTANRDSSISPVQSLQVGAACS